MPDRSRIVEIDRLTGLVTTVLDLEDFTGTAGRYFRLRDTFAFTPPAPQVRSSVVGGHRGGSRARSVTYENGSLAASWRVGADPSGFSHDAALDAASDLLRTLDEKVFKPGRYFEWRPVGASRSSFFEVRGPGTWTPTWSAVQFEQLGTLSIQATWPVAPYVLGLPLWFDDTFDQANALDGYTFQTGVGTLNVTGGELVPTNTTGKNLRRSDRWTVMDGELDFEFFTGTSIASGQYGVKFRQLDTTNYLVAYLDVVGQLRIGKVDGGTFTSLANSAFTAAINTAYWIRARYFGNALTVAIYTTDPSTGSAPSLTVSHTLAGANATKFGDGIKGDVGIYAPTLPNTTPRFRTLRSRPFAFRSLALPGRIDLRGIPGDLPPSIALELASSTARTWLGLGWNKLLGSAGQQPLGVVELANVSGWTSTARNGAHGGTFWQHPNTAAGASTELAADLRVDSLEPDVGSDSCMVEFWMHMLHHVNYVNLIAKLSHSGSGGYGINEVQRLSATAYGSGTATITLGPTGQQVTTAAVAGNASADQIQTAVDAAAGPGRVLISGGTINVAPGLTFEYIGPWGQQDVPALVVNAGWSGGGPGPGTVISTVQAGAATGGVGAESLAVDFPYGRVIPVNTSWAQLLKVGTLSIPVKSNTVTVPLRLRIDYTTGPIPPLIANLEVDYLFAMPAHRSAKMRTGARNDAYYPRLFPALGDYVKRIEPDRSGRIRPRLLPGGWTPATGLGGSAIEPELDANGSCSVVTYLGSEVPDDDLPSASEIPTSRADITFDAWPRFRMAAHG